MPHIQTSDMRSETTKKLSKKKVDDIARCIIAESIESLDEFALIDISEENRNLVLEQIYKIAKQIRGDRPVLGSTEAIINHYAK